MEGTLDIHRFGRCRGLRARPSSAGCRRSPSQGERTVTYFQGCAANYYEVETGWHRGARAQRVPRIDADPGVLWAASNRTPCSTRAALRPTARRRARADGARWARHRRDVDKLRAHAQARGARDCGRAGRRLGAGRKHTFDICEYLLDLHECGELRTDFRPVELTVPYHVACQRRGDGIGTPAVELPRLAPGLEVESGEVCCGVAGTNGLKREKHAVAMDVGAGLFRMIRAMAPELSVLRLRDVPGRSPTDPASRPSTRSPCCTAHTACRRHPTAQPNLVFSRFDEGRVQPLF